MPANLSTILSAVKPRDRTDQYVVLGALYFLNAESEPVTAKQVKDTLKLHLGGRAPSNINACLRTYRAYVEPADRGPPLRWRLTAEGIGRLRNLSGLDLSAAAAADAFGSDIGIVCALEEPEFTAVRDAFGGEKEWKQIGDQRYTHVYREARLVTNSGKVLRVVATTSTSMGLTAAAIATTQLILQFRPRVVVMIGIAAGTRADEKQYGDVLVADPSVDYNSGKVVDANGIREFLPDPYPIGLNARLRSVLKRYGASTEVFAEIRTRWLGKKPLGPNRIHIGPLGAADQVIDDPSRILEITNNWRKLIGVEMETYGVYRACHESPDPKPRMVSFKSVCDFAANKSDSWQDYAAFVAAEFAKDFFKAEWDAVWPA